MHRDWLADDVELKTSACYRWRRRNACAGKEAKVVCKAGGQAWSVWLLPGSIASYPYTERDALRVVLQGRMC